MPAQLLVIGAPGPGEGAEPGVRSAVEQLPVAARWISEDQLQGGAAADPLDGAPPSVVVLLPSLAQPASEGRRIHSRYPDAHLVFVQRPGQSAAFRQSLGIAPRLGRHWSIADAEPARVAAAIRQALASSGQRRQFRSTLAAANERIAGQRSVAASEYQRLVASEYHLANFLKHSSDAVIGLDSRRQVLFWSQGAARLLGTAAAQALGRPLASLGGWTQPLLDALDAMAPGETARTTEVDALLDDRLCTLEATLSVPAASDVQSGASMVLRDVTTRRRAQEQLREANLQLQQLVSSRTQELEKSQLALIQAQKLEAVGRLTGGVAHDFNNVLQIIGSNLQLLQPRVPDAQAARLLQAALEAVDRGAKLASQLLAFARRQPLSPIPLNISRRVAQMGELLRRALGEDVEVETVLAAGLWTTLADPNQLENVILNLAINARDAMPGGGQLTIETANVELDEQYTRDIADVSPGQYVMLAVSDTGHGMPPEVLARVFEPFFTTKPEGLGTGLGLSMAYGFAKQSGGHIRIYSEPGSGTSVKIYLPRSHEKEVSLPPRAAGPLAGGSETILVVEDDLAVQAAVVSTLQSLGYGVLRANEAQAALSILQSGVAVDLLFTDVVMPGPLRSTELAQRAKALMPGLVVLFTSGYTQNAIVHGGRLDPGVHLLSKPYRQEDLARKVRQLLDERRRPPAGPEGAMDAAPGPQDRGAASGGSGLRILVVEDQEDLRETTLQLLHMLGHRPAGAADAGEAEALMEQQGFDVLLTDLNLPGRSGTELAAGALQRRPGLKVVFCSGYGAPTAPLPDGQRSWVLPKPFSAQQLEELLGELATASP